MELSSRCNSPVRGGSALHSGARGAHAVPCAQQLPHHPELKDWPRAEFFQLASEDTLSSSAQEEIFSACPFLQFVVHSGFGDTFGKVGMGLITALGQSNRTLELPSAHGVQLGFLLPLCSCCSLIPQGAGVPRAGVTKANLRGCCCLWLWALDFPTFRSWAQISQHALPQLLSCKPQVPSNLLEMGAENHWLNLGVQCLFFFFFSCENSVVSFPPLKRRWSKVPASLVSLRRTCPAGFEFFGLSKQLSHAVNSIGTNSPFPELISSTWLSNQVCEGFLFECMVHLYK